MFAVLQFLKGTKAGRTLVGVFIILLVLASLIATYKVTTNSYYKSGYAAGVNYTKDQQALSDKSLKETYDAALKKVKDENQKTIDDSRTERDNTSKRIASLQQRITDTERKARSAAAIPRGEAITAGDDPISMLANLSRGMGENGAELAWYANDTLKRLKNCNSEHDIAVKISKQQ